MKRLSIWGAAFVVTAFSAAAFLASTTIARAATECEAEIVKGRASHWTYRLIDGRKCWYEGQSKLSKSELYWPDRKEPTAVVSPPPPAANPPAMAANPPATNAQASPAVENEEFTDPEDGSCCWPPAKEGDSFEARWRSLELKPQN